MLRNQKKAFAWDYLKMRYLYSDMVTSVMIRTVKYETWQTLNFFVSQILLLKIVKMFCEQKRFKFLKDCNDLYYNFWFLIKKRITDKYWKINTATELNKVIKWNVNLPLSVNVFSEEFAEMHCAFFINMFFEYNQILLNPCNHNLTAIQTLIRLLRRTQLL